MTNRERQYAIFHYKQYDRLPVVYVNFWPETLLKWYSEGHITKGDYEGWEFGNEVDQLVGAKLGFDYNFSSNIFAAPRVEDTTSFLYPPFIREIVKEFPDGARHIRQYDGAITLWKPDATGIPAHVGHTLVDRASWERDYQHRLQWTTERVDWETLAALKETNDTRTEPYGLSCGSLFGQIRNWMGLEGISYLLVDDENLYDEIIQTTAEVQLITCEKILETGVKFDFATFWEDIACKNGPLINPAIFNEKVGPYYRRFTELLTRFDIDIVYVDCDGVPDDLMSTWFDNGVNTMFPIEVGTWGGNIAAWRKRFGKELRGFGGMEKKLFAQNYTAIDNEIERLRPLVELGGYIPCPDHDIPPDAIWENVQYYCERMRKVFG
ncbi:MAG: hypothetical protein FWH55_01525 [Oscillospiraceae bacterium]|nr:hypothetical protein [Oscillospiraceae bacterium]